MRALAASLTLVFCASICAASTGMTIVSRVTSSDGKSSTSTSYISSDHARATAGGDMEIIFDATSGSMTTINHTKKTYYVTTRQDIEAMSRKISEKMNSPEMQRAQEQLKNLPPEQRKQVEAQMHSMFALDVQKLGGTRTIAGYKCENWLISVGQMSKTEECMTTDLKLPSQVWDMYSSMLDSMKSIMSAAGPMAGDVDAMKEQMKKIKGFPLATKTTVTMMGRPTVSSSEVIEIRNGSLPADAFDVPAGYTKVENPMSNLMKQ